MSDVTAFAGLRPAPRPSVTPAVTAAQPPAAPTPRPVPAPARLDVVYLELLRWSLAQTGALLPVVVVVQAVLAFGVVVGFGLLIPDLDLPTAAYLATGAPTVLILTVGLVMVPQAVSTARLRGSYTFQRSLPVPRLLLLAADLTMWGLVALPSIAVAVGIGALWYGFELRVDWPLLLGTAALTVLTASATGYAIAVLLPPLLAQVTTQVVLFFIMLFSPVTFPPERLPEWFQALHALLPVQASADAIRAGLLADSYSVSGGSLVVLAVWCVAGLVVTLSAISRRA